MTSMNGNLLGLRSASSALFVLTLLCLLPSALLAESVAPIDAREPGRTLLQPSLEQGSVSPPGDRVAPPVMLGWPQTMGITPPYSPIGVVLADLEGDGDLEVLAGSTNNRFYVWDHDGTLRPGWPVILPGQVQSKASAADLDNDGDLEIIVSVKNGTLHILHHDGTPMSGWPQSTGFNYGLLSPSVYDLDGDHTPEVLLGGGGNVRVWGADGVPRSGWPQAVPGNVSGTLAIGDLVGDSGPEIFAVSTSGDLFGFSPDGAQLPGWPAHFGLSSSYAAPSIGDLDGDGSNEICVVGYSFGAYTEINAYRGDGSAMPGFPVTYPSSQTYSCPVLADADGDGDLEIFNVGKITGLAFYAWDHLGALLAGWPVLEEPNMEGSAIVLDFDGLPGMEIAVGDNNGGGYIYGFNLDGSAGSDFPIPKPGIGGPNSPEVGDVDGDGDLDMAMTTWSGSVILWDFPSNFDAASVEWGAQFHDDWNTNQHGFVVPAADLSAAPGWSQADRAELGSPFPNPVERMSTTIPFALPRSAGVRLSVHDVGGRQVRTLHDGILPRGEHRVEWDGLDDAGRPSAAGIYFLSLETAGKDRLSTKITLIR